MATKTRAVRAASEPKKRAAPVAADKKPTRAKKGAAKAATSAAATTKATKATGKQTEGRQSAASMFRGLIMEGKKTDAQIFEAVQKEFGLDDNKRAYVKWYRNQLTKQGQNPPAEK